MTEAGSSAALLDAVTSLRSSFARLELRSQALARSRRPVPDGLTLEQSQSGLVMW